MNSGTPSTSYFLHEGELFCMADAAIPLNDDAVVQGHGIFETIAAYTGRPFALNDHIKRLACSAGRVGLQVPTSQEIHESLQRVIEANQLQQEPKARLRVTITGGTSNSRTFYEASLPPLHPAEARIVTLPYARNEKGALTGIKTISYGENTPATLFAKNQGADEGIWPNTAGQLCEGTWSNIFLRIRGGWKTPPLAAGCLPGVTRAWVLRLAGEAGIEILEEELEMDQLDAAGAAFLTSSLREIQPVCLINGREPAEIIPDEVIVLKQAYREATKTS